MKLREKLNIFLFVNLSLVFITLLIIMGLYLEKGLGEYKIASDTKLIYNYINAKYPGVWELKNDVLLKGKVVQNENNSFFNELSEMTGLNISIFTKDIFIISTYSKDLGSAKENVDLAKKIQKTVFINKKTLLSKAKMGKYEVIGAYYPIINSKNEVIAVLNAGLSISEIRETSRGMIFDLIIFFIIIMILSLTAMYFFNKALIIDPITILMKKFKNASEGNLTVRTKFKYNDELSELGSYFNEFIENFENLIGKINKTSEKVANASFVLTKDINEIVNGSEENNNSPSMFLLKEKMSDILDNVTSQSAETEEVSATITEISTTVNKVSKNSEETMTLSKETSNYAKLGGQAVEESLDEMKKIELTVRNIEGKAKKLGESSDKIGDIVNMISKISSQTNLLSLNAAIEAARAGEAGKGFAVVAEEVRQLAENSSHATEEIENLITVIQVEVKEVIETVQSGYEEVQKGRQLSEITKEKIESIISKVDSTSGEVGKISSAIEEQAVAIDEINITTENIANKSTNIAELSNMQMDAVDSIVMTLDSTVEFSTELSEVADALKNLVKKFEINSNKDFNESNMITWQDNYSVGVKEMDNEHKKLIQIINNLNNAMLQGKSKNLTKNIIEELIDYTKYHFTHEEKLMKKANYPELAEQIRSHKQFVAKIAVFDQELEDEKIMVSVEIIDFLKDWLIKHILHSDKKYRNVLNRNGIR